MASRSGPNAWCSLSTNPLKSAPKSNFQFLRLVTALVTKPVTAASHSVIFGSIPRFGVRRSAILLTYSMASRSGPNAWCSLSTNPLKSAPKSNFQFLRLVTALVTKPVTAASHSVIFGSIPRFGVRRSAILLTYSMASFNGPNAKCKLSTKRENVFSKLIIPPLSKLEMLEAMVLIVVIKLSIVLAVD